MEGRVEMQANGAASSPWIPYVVPASDQLNQVRVGGSNGKQQECHNAIKLQKLKPYLRYLPSPHLFTCVRLMLQSFRHARLEYQERRRLFVPHQERGHGVGVMCFQEEKTRHLPNKGRKPPSCQPSKEILGARSPAETKKNRRTPRSM
jgi:hypothetical protein